MGLARRRPALGIPASAKYEERGGPSLHAIARLLRTQTIGSDSLVGLLDLTFLDMAVGNADAHAKNLSLLHPEPGVLRLAPGYDVMCTAFYPRADMRPAMAVNGKHALHEVCAADVVAEAASWGLARDRVAARVEGMAARLPSAIAAAARDVPSMPAELVRLVSERVSEFT